MVDPELSLDAVERGELANLVSSQGFKVLLKLALSVVEEFRTDLDNADPAKPQEVMAKHALSKAASVFHTRLINRINNEVSQFMDAPKKSDRPVDLTEGMLDMGEISEAVSEYPNFFGEPFVIEDAEEGV